MLSLPHLYAIINLDSAGNALHFAQALRERGIRLFQIRSKSGDARELLASARELVSELHRKKVDGHRPTVIINDRPDICVLSGADGVHVGQEDIAPEDVRRIVGSNAIVGLSTHNLNQVRQAPFQHITYIGFGPLFESKTKAGAHPVVGVERLKQAVKESRVPVVAIGGITCSNVEEVYRAGASTAAVVRDLEKAVDLSATVAEYSHAFQNAK